MIFHFYCTFDKNEVTNFFIEIKEVLVVFNISKHFTIFKKLIQENIY